MAATDNPGELERWAVDLAEGLLGDSGRRWTHDLGVIARARDIREHLGEDGELLVAAAALHDTGCSPKVRRCRLEPLDAGWYLRDAGAPERLTNLVANLDAAQIEAELRGLHSLLAEFPDEGGPVRDALWYCCLTVGPDAQPMTLQQREDELLVRYAEDRIIVRWYELAKPELAGAIQRTEARLTG
ncbi:MAG TPA: HD domain-containing protein [Solirubrobacteraceae bacterium]|jgi:hypothetical protein|nr:HD domain-containing protein [Solirubrobacteraceae bacterium]